MIDTINSDHHFFETIRVEDIHSFEREIKQKLPSKLRAFYERYYSLEFEGNRLFEIENDMILIKGDKELEVSVHRTLLFDDIKRVLLLESERDGYADYFGTYWSDYLPVISPLGDNGYFMVGIGERNQDQVIFLSYNDDTILKVCRDIFSLFNEHLRDY